MEVERQRKVNKRSWEERKAICEQWKASGKTKREFCRENNIPIASFFPWCNKLWPEQRKKKQNILPIKLINKLPVASENQSTQTEVEIILIEGGPIIRFKLPLKKLAAFVQELSNNAITTIR